MVPCGPEPLRPLAAPWRAPSGGRAGGGAAGLYKGTRLAYDGLWRRAARTRGKIGGRMLIAFNPWGGNDGAFTCPVCHSLRKKAKHCEGTNCLWLKCEPCGIAMNPKNRRVIKLSKK